MIALPSHRIVPHSERTRVLSLFGKLPRAERRGSYYIRDILLSRFSESTQIELRKSWKRNEIVWRQGGWGWRKVENDWYFCQYLTEAGTLTDRGREKLSQVQADLFDETAWREEQKTWEPAAQLPEYLADRLFDYQRKPARQILQAIMDHGGAWDASDTGTGKTYVTAAAAIASGREVGVICPLSVKPAWRRAFAHFGLSPWFIENYEAIKTGGKRDILTCSGKFDYRWQTKPEDVVLIWDEAHRCRKMTTRNAHMMLAAVEQGIPCIAASATLASDPLQMGVTGQLVGLHRGGEEGFKDFVLRHGCRWMLGKVQFCGDRRVLARINRHVFPKHGARVCIDDLGDKFPDTQIICEPFETGHATEIQEAYFNARESIKKMRANGVRQDILESHSRMEWTAARTESERLKIPATLRMVNDLLEEGRSVPIFVNFTATRLELMARLKTQVAIFGGQHPAEREKNRDAFQADQARVIVCQIQAGGEGIDLHDTRGDFPRTSIVMPSPNAVLMRQVFGRVRRAGGVTKSQQIVFFASDTVEEDICKSVRLKLMCVDALNDGDCSAPPDF